MELIYLILFTLFTAFYATNIGLSIAGQEGKKNKSGGEVKSQSESQENQNETEEIVPETNQFDNLDPTIKDNHNLMEHLSKHMKIFQKNYRKPPVGFNSFNYFVRSKKLNNSEEVEVRYTYPLPFDNKKAEFSAVYEPNTTSVLLDKFGLSSNGIDYKGFKPNGVDYRYLVDICYSSSLRVSEHIKEILVKESRFDYSETIETVRNFINHIPYGIPKFDSVQSKFCEIALPTEILVLSYGDCDSKSVFMAGILSVLIGKEKIVLISCLSHDPSKPDGELTPHMMIGVAGLNYKNSLSVTHENVLYHLVETTFPHPRDTKFEVEQIIIHSIS